MINTLKTFYVPISEYDIDKCKKVKKNLIYGRNHPSYIFLEARTCEDQIIKYS